MMIGITKPPLLLKVNSYKFLPPAICIFWSVEKESAAGGGNVTVKGIVSTTAMPRSYRQ